MKCNLCSLHETCFNIRQMGNGKKSARIMIVQESPYEFESRKNQYMGGKAGRLFTGALTEVGIDVDDVYYTAVVKCTTPDDRMPTPEEAKACIDYLWAEIDVIKPEIIVPTGNISLKMLGGITGITKHRGKLIEGKEGYKVFPIIHPNMVLKQPKYMEFFTQDMVNLYSILHNETPQDVVSFSVEYKYGETYQDVVDELTRLINLPPGSEIAFDLETIKTNPYLPKVSMSKTTTQLYPDGLTPEIVAVGLSDRAGYGFAFPLYHRQTPFQGNELGGIVKLMRELFSRSDLHFVAHNGKFDIKWLKQSLDCEVKGFRWDTMLMHYLAVTEEKGTHGLKDLAWVETDMGGYDDELDKVKPKGEDEGNYDLIDWDVLKKYLCGDVDCTMRILDKYKVLVTENERFNWIWDNLMLPGSIMLGEVEHDGAQIDLEWLAKLEESYPREIQRLEDGLKSFPEVLEVERENMDKWQERLDIGSIPRSARTPEQQKKFEVYKKFDPSKGGTAFNFGSTAQLQNLLFDRMGLETVVLTDKQKPSTNDDSLKYMRKQHPICDKILEYRKVRHLYNNFVANFRDMLDENGRVHGSYNIHGTVTGRLSSNEPNMQQLPRHSYNPLLFQYHNEIKNLFISRWGKEGGCIIQFDYSQLELRILGVISQEPELIRLYKDGADLHKEVASSAFGVPISEVTKDMRTAAKKIQFGVVYQESPRGLSEDLRAEGIDLSEDDCERFINNYFKRFPRVEKWVKGVKKTVKRNKQVVNMVGRVRHLEGISSTEKSIANEAERQAVNCPIQSTGSDCTVQALIQINKWLRETGKKSRIVITVHDSIVLDTPYEETIEVAKKVKHIMENLGEYNEFYKFLGDMPLLSEGEIGYSYGESFECSIEELEEQGVRQFLDSQLEKKHKSEVETYKKVVESGQSLPPYINF